MTFRKFYNADAGEAVASEMVATSTAEALARFGKKSDENVADLPPVQIKGNEVETKEETTPPDAKSEEVSTNEKPISETTQKTEVKVDEPKVEEKAPIVQEQPKAATLDEVLKNNQLDTVLNALGFDDEKADFVSKLKDADPKLVAIMQAYENGTLGDYVKELSTDYTKMSAEDVMRHQLRLEYPKASERALEAIYKEEIINRYKLDPDTYTDDEIENGKLLLEAKADKYRDDFQAKQEKFLLPKPPQPKEEVKPDNTAELQRQQIEAYRKELSESPYAKDIIANKKITLGEGEEKFSYPVEMNALVDILTDGKKWSETMWDADGSPKTEHQLAVAAFALDSKKFLSEYAKHLKSVGAKEVIDPIENASKPDGSTSSKSDAEPKTMAEAMARGGRRSNGG